MAEMEEKMKNDDKLNREDADKGGTDNKTSALPITGI